MSIVYDTLMTYLPGKRKTTPSGWTSFNATCCIHNGESADTRMRGGVIGSDEEVSYHCFNCGYKASHVKGRTLSHNMRKLFVWLGIPDDTINKIALQLLREKEGVESTERIVHLPSFDEKELPPDSKPILDWDIENNQYIVKVATYMNERGLYLDDYNFHWSPDRIYRNRLMIPFYYEGKIVGWTARDVTGNAASKYMSHQPVGYVFNLDEQQNNRVFCLVFEGPIDAIYFDGVAILGSEIKDEQALLINRLAKINVLVPDRDSKGKQMVQQAIDLGWLVSFPEWEEGIDDAGSAVEKYGRLYTLHSIIGAIETSPLKIKLRMKKWFG